MGEGYYHDLDNLLAQKDEEIDRLNATIVVYSSRTSNLQTRLLHTLDALDENRRRHTDEVKDLDQKYIRLDRRLRKHKKALATYEAERDDLKESVLELCEKVEQSNDIRSWPFNRLQLTKFTEHSRQVEAHTQSSPTGDAQLGYASAIIERLRRERDEERVAHRFTREALQSKIDTLVAQLARREAELEFYATHTTCVPSGLSGRTRPNEFEVDIAGLEVSTGPSAQAAGSSKSKDDATALPPAQLLTNEEIIKMLDTTAARNRALEVEIKTLFKRLHQARSTPSPSPLAPTETVSPQLHLRGQDTVAQPQFSGLSASPTKNDMIAGNRPSRNYDGLDSVNEDSNDRADRNEQWHIHSHTDPTRTPSRTRAHRPVDTASGQASSGDTRSNRPISKARRLRKPSTNVDTRKDEEQVDLNQDQELGTPRLYQSTPIPLSDTIDDHHSAHDDNDDVIWLSTSPVYHSRVLTSNSGAPSAQEYVSAVPGSRRTVSTRAVMPADANTPDLQSTSLRQSRSGSAALASLDVEIQELSSQIDAFQHERDKLSKFVATRRRQTQRAAQGKIDSIAADSLVITPVAGGDQSEGYREVDTAVKFTLWQEGTDVDTVHDNDRDAVLREKDSRTDDYNALVHRLNIVEHDCLQENELLEEIQTLQRRVAELSLLTHAQSNEPPAPLLSAEHDIPSFLDLNAGGQDQSLFHHRLLQQKHEMDHGDDSLSLHEPVSSVAPDNTSEDDLHTSHLRPRDRASDEDDLRTEAHPPYVDELPAVTAEAPLVSPPQLQPLPDARAPLLHLGDAELDGLLDVIDGEASMELATPLMPTTLVVRTSPTSSSPPTDFVDPQTDSKREDRDAAVQSDTDSGNSREMILVDSELENSLPQIVSSHEGRESVLSDGHHDDRENSQVETGRVGNEKNERDDDGGGLMAFNTDGVGDAPHLTGERGVLGFFPDDSLHDDVDTGDDAGGRGDFRDPSLSAPLSREGDREDEFDDDGRSSADESDGLEESDRLDEHNTEDGPRLREDGDHHDSGAVRTIERLAELEEVGQQTVLMPTQSHPQFQFPTSPHHPDLQDASLDERSSSDSPDFPRPPSRFQERLRSGSPAISDDEEAPDTESILARAERDLADTEEMLEQGENALRRLEASLSLGSDSPRLSESPPPS
ncbi:hypothetical protein AN958_10021 [Leucoagaricus sp. SymC.cos]|nr:hypothetical protein AN958_10021 [Leucoagaricus sp. SymC.cos]